MLIKPEKIVFETPNDIIDYVSRGMVPCRKNFEQLMYHVRVPDDQIIEVKEKRDIYVPAEMFIDIDQATFEATMRRVYENRVRNRNITLGIVGAVAVVAFVGGVCKHNSDKKESNSSSCMDDAMRAANSIDV